MMAISLEKGQKTALGAGLTQVTVGVGWNPRLDAGDGFDLDASAFLLNADGKVRSNDDCIYFNQRKSPCGAVVHMGDNCDGAGDGDDEKICVFLSKVPADVERIVFTVTIYGAKARRQNFGMVDSAFIRIVDGKTGEEIARFELTEDACVNQALVFGELYRRHGAWKFRAIGEGYDYEINELAAHFGCFV